MQRVIAALLALGFAAPASAQDPAPRWRLVADEGASLSFENESAREQRGDLVSAWSVVYSAAPQTAYGKPYAFVFSHDVYDCRQSKVRTLTMTFYDAEAKRVDDAGEGPMAPVAPGSGGERLMTAACTGKFKGEATFASLTDLAAFARATLEARAKSRK